VDTYETIVFEDIAPSNLSRRAKPKQDEDGKYLPNGASAKSGLNKSILDAGWHQFITFCQYKAEDAGTQVVLVDPRYTSQICSGCGTIVKKTLDERWHSCECGCELDRDHNAAINIKALWVGSTRQLAQAG
jgi:putative transposase